MLELFLSKLEEEELEAEEFFILNDRNHSGELSLVQLRNGLFELGFSMNQILGIMMSLDKNLDGSISIEEYLSVLNISVSLM